MLAWRKACKKFHSGVILQNCISSNCFSNNTTFASSSAIVVSHWRSVPTETVYCFEEHLCTQNCTRSFGDFLAYEHSYDMVFLVDSKLELYCCIFSLSMWRVHTLVLSFSDRSFLPMFEPHFLSRCWFAKRRMTVVSHNLTCYDIQAQHKHVPLSSIFASTVWIIVKCLVTRKPHQHWP